MSLSSITTEDTKINLSNQTASDYCTVLVCAAVLYGICCAPGLLWQDSGLIHYRVLTNDIEGGLGLALSHPGYYLVAIATKAIPIGSPVHKVNLLSGMAAAIAVANLYALVLWITRARTAALAGAMALCLSHTFWFHACIAETYTVWLAVFTAELIALYRYDQTSKARYLYMLSALNGMAVSIHMLAVISLAVYMICVPIRIRSGRIGVKAMAWMVVSWAAGAMPLLGLVARRAAVDGQIASTLGSVLFGSYWKEQVLNTHVTASMAIQNLQLWLLNFPSPVALLAGWGAVRALAGHRRPVGIVLIALLAGFGAFAFRYTVPDRFAFFLPFYTVAAMLIGIGAGSLTARCRSRWTTYGLLLMCLWPAALYAVLPELAGRLGMDIPTRTDLPFRDNRRYFLQPWKTHCTGPQHYTVQVFKQLPAHAVLYADLTTVGPLLTAQLMDGLRPDVSVVNPHIPGPHRQWFSMENLHWIMANRPVFVTSALAGYCPAQILSRYRLVRAGPVWQVLDPAGQ